MPRTEAYGKVFESEPEAADFIREWIAPLEEDQGWGAQINEGSKGEKVEVKDMLEPFEGREDGEDIDAYVAMGTGVAYSGQKLNHLLRVIRKDDLYGGEHEVLLDPRSGRAKIHLMCQNAYIHIEDDEFIEDVLDHKS
jgi:hypothetical protein